MPSVSVRPRHARHASVFLNIDGGTTIPAGPARLSQPHAPYAPSMFGVVPHLAECGAVLQPSVMN
jgi:hypothetical protein